MHFKDRDMRFCCLTYLGFFFTILVNYWLVPVCQAQDGKLQIVYMNQTYINSMVKQQNNYGVGSANPNQQATPSDTNEHNKDVDNKASLKSENTQFSPYFGVEFVPYVKSASVPISDYSSDELTTMLKVVLTKSHSVLTMEMGYKDQSYTDGPWDTTTASHIATLAANINQENNRMLLTVNQGAGVLSKPGFQPDIEAAFNSAQQANAVFPKTVWGITLIPNYKDHSSNDGLPRIGNSGNFVLAQLGQQLTTAHAMNLKLGVYLDQCEDILGGPLKTVLIDMAKFSDYFICTIFPNEPISEPQDYFNWVIKQWQTIRSSYHRHAPNLEIFPMTGWATQGQSLSNPEYMNSPKKSQIFWDGMKRWAEAMKIKVFMHQAFDVPRTIGNESWGYWRKIADGGDYFEEKVNRQPVIVSL